VVLRRGINVRRRRRAQYVAMNIERHGEQDADTMTTNPGERHPGRGASTFL
jgi:hypothetical protein